MRRLAVLDGMRGYFLVFMMLNHLVLTGGVWLVKINHAELSFVQDAQGFIFLSGLLVGLIYTKYFARGDAPRATRKILRRALELYVYAMLVLLLVLIGYATLDYSWEFWGGWLQSPEHTVSGYIGLGALLLYQPIFMDILPQYILYLLVSPWLIALAARGQALHVPVGSARLWLAVQLGAHLPFAASAEALIQSAVPAFMLRSGFNPLAWQVVFVSGLLIGATASAGQIDWQGSFRADRTLLLKISLALLAFFLVWRVGFTWGIWHEITGARFRTYDTREEFSLVFLLNFAALAYVAAWLLVAGPRSPDPLARKAAAVLWRLFTLPFLTFLGKHSLQVYAYHVVVAYAVVAIDWHYGPFTPLAKTVLALAAIASLAVPALAHERVQRAAVAPSTARG
jgi:hypothetical protein